MAETVRENLKMITGILVTIGLFFAGYSFNNMSDELKELGQDVKEISETVIELKTNMHYVNKEQDAMKLEMQVIKGEHNAIIRQSER